MCKGEISFSGGLSERVKTGIMDKEGIVSDSIKGLGVSCVVEYGVVVLSCSIFLIMEIATVAYWRVNTPYITVQFYEHLLTFKKLKIYSKKKCVEQ